MLKESRIASQILLLIWYVSRLTAWLLSEVRQLWLPKMRPQLSYHHGSRFRSRGNRTCGQFSATGRKYYWDKLLWARVKWEAIGAPQGSGSGAFSGGRC